MNKTTEALKLAEEALNAMLTHMGMDEDEWTKPTFNQAREALAAIREALAEQEKQEPVAWAYIDADGSFMDALDRQHGAYQTPLYDAPVDAKALLETERKRHAFELSMQEELFADKAEAIRSEALEEAAKVCRTAQAKGLQSIREAIEEAIRVLK